MSPPIQKPHRSNQSVGTPAVFTRAVLNRLNEHDFRIDLAADLTNRVTHEFISEEEDSLSADWEFNGWCWLNPPYSDITPWVKKAWESTYQFGTKTCVLVPASTGSNWWRDWVEGKAYITYLNGRITFTGHTAPYPKDLALLLYAPFLQGGSTTWTWRHGIAMSTKKGEYHD